MSRTVVFLQTAADDLLEIRRYIRKNFSQQVWLDSYARINKAILNLEQFPHAGHPLPELPATHFMQILAVKNRVIYEVVADKVYIHLICDSRQDFKIKLARRPLRTLRF
ncbi:type II toxin-antitoxin system RelE/ParE family toxin [Achromobacter spanius]|uniref:Plasmid stabilization protein n=1 Tax=Achromobacter spanius TaxID=217203 RepID=A0A2S0IA16_9BURK|nr:type II toxin-antitoxin system RelE/ParE family toxin [Achromobacter spanius]AVJ28899.1 plasmid stabilization protein [Achromobacter spanius]